MVSFLYIGTAIKFIGFSKVWLYLIAPAFYIPTGIGIIVVYGIIHQNLLQVDTDFL